MKITSEKSVSQKKLFEASMVPGLRQDIFEKELFRQINDELIKNFSQNIDTKSVNGIVTKKLELFVFTYDQLNDLLRREKGL